MNRGGRSLDVVLPVDPIVVRKGVVSGRGQAGQELSEGALTKAPCLVKVDRYGSVSDLVRVRVPLGFLIIARMKQGRSSVL